MLLMTICFPAYASQQLKGLVEDSSMIGADIGVSSMFLPNIGPDVPVRLHHRHRPCRSRITLANMVYNVKRWCWLDGRIAPERPSLARALATG